MFNKKLILSLLLFSPSAMRPMEDALRTQFQDHTWRLRTGYYGVRRDRAGKQEIQKSLETIISSADQLLAAHAKTIPAKIGANMLDIEKEKEKAQEYLRTLQQS